jgi:O-acetyl-ADP-ribose deacetylase (regulator of RNase III)
MAAFELQLHLRDLSRSMIAAWEAEFANVANVTISRGDIFSEKKGQIEAKDPIDVRADAIISPANSFGFMDGGIDAVYTYVLGPQVQERLLEVLRRDFAGELPVGQALIVETDNDVIPWCISAPTMRVPMGVADTVNAYLAFRGALLAVKQHNASGKTPIRSVLTPGLGTAVGNMPHARCAKQMRRAWDRVMGLETFAPASLRRAAEDQERLLE